MASSDPSDTDFDNMLINQDCIANGVLKAKRDLTDAEYAEGCWKAARSKDKNPENVCMGGISLALYLPRVPYYAPNLYLRLLR